MLEELGVWPEMTLRETQKLRALPYLRRWIAQSQSESIPEELVPTLCEIGRKVWIEYDRL